MIRVFSILSRTLAATRAGSTATRAGSAASFAVPHRFLQAAHYGSSTASDGLKSRRRIFYQAAAATVAATAASTVVVVYLTYDWHEMPPLNGFTDDIVIYQVEASLSSHQVRVFLDYYDIPYKVVEVTPFQKKDDKQLNGSPLVNFLASMPIVIIDGEQLNDSSAIIDRLGQKILSKQKADSTSEDDEETKWRRWADDHLLPILAINMFRTAPEMLESIDYMTSNVNYRHKMALKIKLPLLYVWFKLIERNHNIADIRAALYEALETWVDALNGREFLGGSQPNLADLAVFGALRATRCLRCGMDMVEHTRIGEWYTRMVKAVGKSSGIEV